MRFHEIAGQLTDRRAFDTVDEKLAGLFRFILGLARTVVILMTEHNLAQNEFGFTD